MRFVITSPAATAPSREGLELAIRARTANEGATTLLLGVGEGAVELVLGVPDGQVGFSHGPVRLTAATAAEGRAFVDEVARWFGLELTAASADGDEPAPPGEATPRRRPRLRASWIQLGDGTDPSGVAWHAYKLCLDLGKRDVEIFLRLSADGSRAQLVEKSSLHRRDLVELLERVLSKDAPRVVREAHRDRGG